MAETTPAAGAPTGVCVAGMAVHYTAGEDGNEKKRQNKNTEEKVPDDKQGEERSKPDEDPDKTEPLDGVEHGTALGEPGGDEADTDTPKLDDTRRISGQGGQSTMTTTPLGGKDDETTPVSRGKAPGKAPKRKNPPEDPPEDSKQRTSKKPRSSRGWREKLKSQLHDGFAKDHVAEISTPIPRRAPSGKGARTRSGGRRSVGTKMLGGGGRTGEGKQSDVVQKIRKFERAANNTYPRGGEAAEAKAVSELVDAVTIGAMEGGEEEIAGEDLEQGAALHMRVEMEEENNIMRHSNYETASEDEDATTTATATESELDDVFGSEVESEDAAVSRGDLYWAMRAAMDVMGARMARGNAGAATLEEIAEENKKNNKDLLQEALTKMTGMISAEFAKEAKRLTEDLNKVKDDLGEKIKEATDSIGEVRSAQGKMAKAVDALQADMAEQGKISDRFEREIEELKKRCERTEVAQESQKQEARTVQHEHTQKVNAVRKAMENNRQRSMQKPMPTMIFSRGASASSVLSARKKEDTKKQLIVKGIEVPTMQQGGSYAEKRKTTKRDPDTVAERIHILLPEMYEESFSMGGLRGSITEARRMTTMDVKTPTIKITLASEEDVNKILKYYLPRYHELKELQSDYSHRRREAIDENRNPDEIPKPDIVWIERPYSTEEAAAIRQLRDYVTAANACKEREEPPFIADIKNMTIFQKNRSQEESLNRIDELEWKISEYVRRMVTGRLNGKKPTEKPRATTTGARIEPNTELQPQAPGAVVGENTERTGLQEPPTVNIQ